MRTNAAVAAVLLGIVAMGCELPGPKGTLLVSNQLDSVHDVTGVYWFKLYGGSTDWGSNQLSASLKPNNQTSFGLPYGSYSVKVTTEGCADAELTLDFSSGGTFEMSRWGNCGRDDNWH